MRRALRLIAVFAAAAACGGARAHSEPCANPTGGYEGFGRGATGGAGRALYRVTHREDGGRGSLRDALARGNRCVVFEVGGAIALSRPLPVKGDNVTIDGFTAPAPGITLQGGTLVIRGARNVVVRGIRHRGAPPAADGIRIYGASDVVIDQVSVSGYGDGAIDVTEQARRVTIQWSILGEGNPTAHGFINLIGYGASRVSVHHNLYINGTDRHPYCGRNSVAEEADEPVCDVRNNLIWNYRHGTSVRADGTANVVNNYYYTAKPASSEASTIYVRQGGLAYARGNRSANGWDIDALGNRDTPFPAVAPRTTDAVTAARQVLARAGARGPRFGLDATDLGYLGQISLGAVRAD
jgi:pectate lyase